MRTGGPHSGNASPLSSIPKNLIHIRVMKHANRIALPLHLCS